MLKGLPSIGPFSASAKQKQNLTKISLGYPKGTVNHCNSAYVIYTKFTLSSEV